MADRSKGNIIQQCAEQAKAAGYSVFGVQYYHECWADKKEECCRYKKYGNVGPNKCPGGIGRGWTNAVYRIEGETLAATRPSIHAQTTTYQMERFKKNFINLCRYNIIFWKFFTY